MEVGRLVLKQECGYQILRGIDKETMSKFQLLLLLIRHPRRTTLFDVPLCYSFGKVDYVKQTLFTIVRYLLRGIVCCKTLD